MLLHKNKIWSPKLVLQALLCFFLILSSKWRTLTRNKVTTLYPKVLICCITPQWRCYVLFLKSGLISTNYQSKESFGCKPVKPFKSIAFLKLSAIACLAQTLASPSFNYYLPAKYPIFTPRSSTSNLYVLTSSNTYAFCTRTDGCPTD